MIVPFTIVAVTMFSEYLEPPLDPAPEEEVDALEWCEELERDAAATTYVRTYTHTCVP